MTIFLQSGGVTEILNEPIQYVGTAYVGDSITNYVGAADLLNPDAIYRNQRAVRTVVNFIAHNAASVALQGYTVDEDDERKEVRTGPVAATLASPDRVATAYEYQRDLFTDQLLWERFAAAKTRADDGGLVLTRIPPHLFRFRRVGGRPVALVVGDREFPIDRFLWIDGYPASESSPMGHLQDLLLEEAESARFRADLWRRGAKMGGFVERPLDAPDWSPNARRRFMSMLDERYTGDGSRVGGTALLEDGMKYVAVTHMSSRDAQQIEARKLSTSEVAAAYQVPPVFVGVLDNANYSNVKAYRQMLYSDVLGPLFTQSQQAWTKRVGDDLSGVDLIEHRTDVKLQVSFEEEAAMLQSAVGRPYMTVAEARKRRNLPFIEGTDELTVPLNVSVDGSEPDPTDEDEPALSGGNDQNDSEEEST